MTDEWIVMVRSDMQPLKRFSSKLVTEGKLTFVSDVQPLKALDPTLVTLFGMVAADKTRQSLNAPIPMLMTEGGLENITLFSPLLPNVPSPMLVTLLGIMTLDNARQPLKT